MLQQREEQVSDPTKVNIHIRFFHYLPLLFDNWILFGEPLQSTMERLPLLLTFIWLYSTLLPEPWADKLNCGGRRTLGISPLRGSLRAAHPLNGQRYHYRRTRSWRDSLPRLLLGWMGTAHHLIWPSLMQFLCTGGLGASAPSLFPIAGLSAEVIQLPDMTALHGVFQGPQNRIAGSGKIVTWIAEK